MTVKQIKDKIERMKPDDNVFPWHTKSGYVVTGITQYHYNDPIWITPEGAGYQISNCFRALINYELEYAEKHFNGDVTRWEAMLKGLQALMYPTEA